jgi:hypothetical protein
MKNKKERKKEEGVRKNKCEGKAKTKEDRNRENKSSMCEGKQVIYMQPLNGRFYP